ncbi:leucine-rich repeat domain-containing protein [Promethearchaeum syntrophicum]|uniref:Leucine-rich repeat domain-containing protein n=1 Tax=Promethearchaeum syntrophicum TaxID=2594042 RepID=A0A5B9DDK5_9ARCH|nr:leucine-rich repeat domain-containing protein [Candidatus Prometheoarchaeum syntrophicum]QEE16796.1 DNA polymerase III subunit epsilon [Candidatus Prometheoarchaeum syntrophicum]
MHEYTKITIESEPQIYFSNKTKKLYITKAKARIQAFKNENFTLNNVIVLITMFQDTHDTQKRADLQPLFEKGKTYFINGGKYREKNSKNKQYLSEDVIGELILNIWNLVSEMQAESESIKSDLLNKNHIKEPLEIIEDPEDENEDCEVDFFNRILELGNEIQSDVDAYENDKKLSNFKILDKKEILIIDIETTGLSKNADLIVEIGICLLDLKNGDITKKFDNVISEFKLKEQNKKAWIFHNSTLTVKEVEEKGIHPEEFAGDLQELFDKYYITAYNSKFDFGFLEVRGFEFHKANDIMALAKEEWQIVENHEIKNPTVQECIDLIMNGKNKSNRAYEDSVIEAKILYYLIKKHGKNILFNEPDISEFIEYKNEKKLESIVDEVLEECCNDIVDYHGVSLIRQEYDVLMELEGLIGVIPNIYNGDHRKEDKENEDDELDDDNDDELDNDEDNIEEYEYDGFIAEEHHITQLLLPEKGIKNLPESIGNLDFLKKLHLTFNKLTILPESICNLKSLEILILSYNQLAYLPDKIGKLKKLKKLYLMYNKLTTLPNSIEKLTNLEELYLHENPICSYSKKIIRWMENLELNGCNILKMNWITEPHRHF